MINRINEIVEKPDNAFGQGIKERDGYIFTSICNPLKRYDAIVIKYPHSITCESPNIIGSKKSLKEQINIINRYKIDKALIISDNIEFLQQCPTLKHLVIYPSDDAGNNFDYSPLYEMPEIKSLCCSVIYGNKNQYKTKIDLSKIKGLQYVSIGDYGFEGLDKLKTIKTLQVTGHKLKDLAILSKNKLLDTLMIRECKIENLNGIEDNNKLQCLYLFSNRNLEDISDLKKSKRTLKSLRIDKCPKITDFSVLKELENLELLELSGNNKIKNLDFLKELKNLKVLNISFFIENGDLTPCLNIPYVFLEKERKHYNLKDSAFSKNKEKYKRGNENIEEWRRLGNY